MSPPSSWTTLSRILFSLCFTIGCTIRNMITGDLKRVKQQVFWVLCFHNALSRYFCSSHRLLLLCGFTLLMWGSSLACNYPIFPQFFFSPSHFRARCVFSSVMKGISFSSCRSPIRNYWKHLELIVLRDSTSWIPASSSFRHFIYIFVSWDIAWWKVLIQDHNWVKSNPYMNVSSSFCFPDWTLTDTQAAIESLEEEYLKDGFPGLCGVMWFATVWLDLNKDHNHFHF